jgi:hypothetical protein
MKEPWATYDTTLAVCPLVTYTGADAEQCDIHGKEFRHVRDLDARRHAPGIYLDMSALVV